MQLENSRILIIIPYPIVPLIGPCFRCLRQARALLRYAADVYIISPRLLSESDRGKINNHLFNGLHILPILPNSSSSLVRELKFLFRTRKVLKKQLKEIRPHIVHVHNPPDTLAFTVSGLCSSENVPLVYDIHDSAREVISASDFNRIVKTVYISIGNLFESQVIKRSSGVVAVSEAMRDLLLSTRPAFKKYAPPVAVMRNLAEPLDYAVQATSPVKEHYLFYSGTLYSGFLGLQFLIESLEDVVKKMPLKVYIAGDGPDKPNLERLIADRNLSQKIILLGRISKKEVLQYTSGAMLTVIPYLKNALTEIALPGKLFEYMAMGKPVVFSNLAGFREVLGEDNAGQFKAEDGEDLKRTVVKLFTDAGTRTALGLKNRMLFEQISFESEFSNLLQLYTRILMKE